MKAPLRQWLTRRRASRQISDYLAITREPRLHLGCGMERFDGWLNADLNGAIFLDVREPFPIPDRAIAYVYHEHVIEHLPLTEARNMLNECFRVLRSSGVMRVSCPDFHLLARCYVDTPAYFFESPIFQEPGYGQFQTALQRLCHLVYGFDHRWMWDFESLEKVLTDIGFADIEHRDFCVSPHSTLRNLDRERRRLQSMYVEARKP